MSQQGLDYAYVYQPEPAGSNDGYIYAVSGPKSEGFRRYRFKTAKEAQDVAGSINRRALTSAALIAVGRARELK